MDYITKTIEEAEKLARAHGYAGLDDAYAKLHFEELTDGNENTTKLSQ